MWVETSELTHSKCVFMFSTPIIWCYINNNIIMMGGVWHPPAISPSAHLRLSSSANQRPVSRSRDQSGPIRGHRKCLGRVALTGRKWALSPSDQREESGQWMVAGAICREAVCTCSFIATTQPEHPAVVRDSRACHNIGNISSSLQSLPWPVCRVHTLIIMRTLVQL